MSKQSSLRSRRCRGPSFWTVLYVELVLSQLGAPAPHVKQTKWRSLAPSLNIYVRQPKKQKVDRYIYIYIYIISICSRTVLKDLKKNEKDNEGAAAEKKKKKTKPPAESEPASKKRKDSDEKKKDKKSSKKSKK